MLKLFKSKLIHHKDKLLCIVLTENSITIKLHVNGEENTPVERSLENITIDEDVYLQNIANVLREELSWLDIGDDMHLGFLLDKSILEIENFVLPPMPKKEEKEAIGWEVSESIGLEKDSYYYKVQKNKEKDEGEYHYTIYAADKTLVNKLAGMTQGFNVKLAFISPFDISQSFEDMTNNDLLPRELQSNEINIMLTNWTKYFVFLCIVASSLIILCLEFLLYDKICELKNVEKSLKLESFWQENLNLTNSIEQKTKRLNTILKRLDDTTIKHSKMLEALGRSNVPGLWITSVETEGLNYRITGRSVDMLGLNAWMEELTINSSFKNTKVISTEARSLGLSFIVTISER